VEKCGKTCQQFEWQAFSVAGEAISFVVRNLIVPHSPNMKKKGGTKREEHGRVALRNSQEFGF